MFFNLTNPIPHTVKDEKKLYEWLGEHRLIPYFGSAEHSSHAMLELIETLCEFSPTFKACMKARMAYTFGLNVEIVGRAVPGLAGERVEVPYERQLAFTEMLRDIGLPLGKLTKLSRTAEMHQVMSGNSYLRIIRTMVGGQTSYTYKVLHFKQCLYKESEDPGEEFIVHSKFLTDVSKLAEYPPSIYRVTESGEALRWMTIGDGTEVALVHIKNEDTTDEGEYYGRTDIIAILTWLYVEFQSGNHQSKVAHAEFVSKLLILMQAESSESLPDPALVNAEDGTQPGKGKKKLDTFQRNMIILKEITTAMDSKGTKLGPKSDQAALAGIEYPHGTETPSAIKLDVDRDTKHADWQMMMAAKVIAATVGWSVDLTSLRQPTASLGSSTLNETWAQKNAETIQPRQTWWENFWNDLVAQICELEGAGSEFKAYGINFPDSIGEKLANQRETNEPGEQTNTDGDPAPSTPDEDDDDA